MKKVGEVYGDGGKLDGARMMLEDFLDKVICGDCLKLMSEFPNNSIDMVLCDLPYGVTQNVADTPIDLTALWAQYKRIVKERSAIVLTSQFPFSIDLINANRDWFKYDLIWNKVLISGFLNALRMPLRVHEHILVFYNKAPKFNPQFRVGEPAHSRGKMRTRVNRNYGKFVNIDTTKLHGSKKFPLSILTFQKPHAIKALHPTEKPVDLMEYLIKSYSDEGDIVLDNCVGTGATVIAAKRSHRRYIGIDINPEYCEIARKRLAQVEWSLEAYS